MLRGLTTISYYADDMVAATQWYRTFLGVAPYFRRPEDESAAPQYVEFRLGDYQHELGLIDSRFRPDGSAISPAGTVTYWHVDDVTAAYERLLSLGATAYQAPTNRGAGFITASVVDPFGNILGIMYNPHYLDVLAGSPHTLMS